MELADLEARMTKKGLKHKILKDYLEISMQIWDDNIKLFIKGTSFDFTRISSTITQGQKRCF